jgi:hypothetical protein
VVQAHLLQFLVHQLLMLVAEEVEAIKVLRTLQGLLEVQVVVEQAQVALLQETEHQEQQTLAAVEVVADTLAFHQEIILVELADLVL